MHTDWKRKGTTIYYCPGVKRESTETQYHIFTGLMLTKGDGAEKYNKAMTPSTESDFCTL